MLQAVVSVIVTLTLALWAGTALEDRLMRVDTLHSSTRAVITRMGRALLIVLAVLASLSMVGIDPTVLSVFGGALGVGLGLGLQKDRQQLCIRLCGADRAQAGDRRHDHRR
ncbi:hypothetical protein ACFS07_25990 [Undibacterium arcticum]